ncbi:hypothetical protein HRI91_004546 [Salmonella enterica]|nr:hypothetical protein [Salmonella enterica]
MTKNNHKMAFQNEFNAIIFEFYGFLFQAGSTKKRKADRMIDIFNKYDNC